MVKAKETLTTWSRTHRLFTAQTSWFTVWANGKQNFRLVNFVTESRLPLIFYKSVPFTKKWLRRPDTGIKMRLHKWNTNFSLEHSTRKKQNYLFRCSGCYIMPKNVPLEQTKTSCSIHFPTGFYGKVLLKVNNHCFHYAMLQSAL